MRHPVQFPACAAALFLLATACGGGGGGGGSAVRPPNGNLRVTALGISDQPATGPAAGHEVQVQTTILAQGRAFTDVPVLYLFANKADLDAGVKPVRYALADTVSYADVPLGETVHDTWLRLPATLTAGDWVLLSAIDPADVFAETDEADNRPENSVRLVVTVDDSHVHDPDIALDAAEPDRTAIVPSPMPTLLGTLAQRLGIDPTCTQHLSLDVVVHATGDQTLHDVDVDLSIELPAALQFDPPGLPSFQVPVPAAFRSIPLGVWDAATHTFHGFAIPELVPGRPLELHLSVCIPDALIASFNAFVTYVRQLWDTATHLAFQGMRAALKVAINAQHRIAEFEDGIRRLVGADPDNNITRQITIFESLLDVIPNDQPVTLASSFTKTFGSTNLGLGIDCHGSGTVDRTGGRGAVHVALPCDIVGTHFDLLAANGHGGAGPLASSPAPGYSADLSVLGGTIATWQLSGPDLSLTASPSFSIQKQLLRRNFMVGPVPMSAELDAGGSVGVRFGVTLDPAGSTIDLSAAPFLSAGVSASVGIDAVVVQFGVRGDFTIVDIAFPFRIQAGMSLVNNGADLRADLLEESAIEITGPSGSMSLYLTVGVPVLKDILEAFGATGSVNLIDYEYQVFQITSARFRNVLADRHTTTTMHL